MKARRAMSEHAVLRPGAVAAPPVVATGGSRPPTDEPLLTQEKSRLFASTVTPVSYKVWVTYLTVYTPVNTSRNLLSSLLPA